MQKKKAKTPVKGAKPKPQAPRKEGSLNKIGALWLKKGKNGNMFMSGRIDVGNDNEMSLLVFKNGYKDQPNHPDYVIYEPSDVTGTTPAKFQPSDDDIPF